MLKSIIHQSLKSGPRFAGRRYSSVFIQQSSRVTPKQVLSHTHSLQSPLLQVTRRPQACYISLPTIQGSKFHTTPRNHGGPLFPLFAVLLKASTSFEIARTASRIAMTLMPAVMIRNYKSRKFVKYAALYGIPHSEEKSRKKIKCGSRLLRILVMIPFTLFCATIIASLERTPLTGRWRMIILSPEEEDTIASQLAGMGWYNAVMDILAQEGSPVLIPSNDWRYIWVNDTLRKLERIVPLLAGEKEQGGNWLESFGPETKPMPPPAKYPLRPRPKASEYLRWFCETISGEKIKPLPHAIQGPPYSLLLIDNPNASNAFSYGFGPDGGGGVVVYSGFLDDIFARMPPEYPAPPEENKPWLSKLLGNIFNISSTTPRHPTPTQEQTAELAILLAHELSHLILSHHLESLSSETVIIPGTLSILSDVIRVLIFPITMFFGPFFNDAVAQLGNVGSGELVKMGEYCTSVKQEMEADVVSARLLAHSGFDARDAVRFWEHRSSSEAECSISEHVEKEPENKSMSLVRRIMGSRHPISEVRVKNLKEELDRWESERQEALAYHKTRNTTTPAPTSS